MSISTYLKIFFFLLSLLFVQNVNAHSMGSTFSNLKYSGGILTLETRIFYSDFYYEFQKSTSVKNKDYIKSGIDKADQKDLEKYFRKNIRIWSDNKALYFDTFSFKFERHDEDAYILIVELSAKAKITDKSKIKIFDSVLLNTIMGQKHLINVFLKDTDNPSHGIITLDKQHPAYEFVNE